MNTSQLLLAAMVTLGLVACSDNKPATQAETTSSTTTAAMTPEQHVAAREQNMKSFAKASKELKAMAEGKEAFDAAKMQATVAVFNTQANQGWEHFDASTKGVDSEAKAAVWEQNADFQQQVKNFQAAVADLNTAAAKGTVDAIQAPLAKVGDSCKSCHSTFKD